MYADFESILKPMGTVQGQRTVKKDEHIACSYAYLITSTLPDINFEPRLYVGLDSAEHFLNSLTDDFKRYIKPIIERNVDMIWNDDAQQLFDQAVVCHICNKPLNRDENVIVRDHDHFQGTFRGAAHQECNLKYKIDKKRYKLPVIFHNLRGYDSHLIMQAIKKKYGKIRVIPNNYENYQSFTLGYLKFLDSHQFLPDCLSELARKMNVEDFKYISRFFPTPNERVLMLQKGFYPYNYMTSMSKFDETELPPQTAFYNQLIDEPLKDCEYEHVKTVWRTFQCQTMRDYHNLYLSSDVYLLADIFEKFRVDSLSMYGLEPTYYYSLPGLAWDAALKHSDIELELIRDIDTYLMIEKGIRGGISMISNRYAKANDPRMGSDYNQNMPTKTILYLDANSLYPTAMCEPLPIDEFSMVNNPESLDVMQVGDYDKYGYILEIDGYMPREKHEQFNDYPLAPEKKIVTHDMLSPFQKQHFPSTKSVKKLVPHLDKLEKYVLHYRNLKLYIELGFVVTKIHRAVRFRQGAWLKSFMELCIEKRREAALIGDKARVAIIKFIMNAVFGKAMENVRTHMNIELLTSDKIFKKRIAKPNFKGSKRFHDDLVAVELIR